MGGCACSGARPRQGAGGALRERGQPRPELSWRRRHTAVPPGPGSVIHSDSGSAAVSA